MEEPQTEKVDLLATALLLRQFTQVSHLPSRQQIKTRRAEGVARRCGTM